MFYIANLWAVSAAMILAVSSGYATNGSLLDLPEEKLCDVISFLPAQDLASLGMCNRQLNDLQHEECKRAISMSSFNKAGYEAQDHFLLATLPYGEVERRLRAFMAEESYIAVPFCSSLAAFMPEEFCLAQLSDWQSHVELVKPLYHAAFGAELPEAHQVLALQQLIALVGVSVYITPVNSKSGLEHFLHQHGKKILSFLQDQTKVRPYVNLLHGDLDDTALAEKPHTLVLTDAELARGDVKQRLDQLLADQNAHHVHVSIGKSSMVKDGVFDVKDADLPALLGNLMISDPAGEAITIGNEFLRFASLRSLGLHLPKLAGIGDYFINDNNALESLVLHLPKLAIVGQYFVNCNSALKSMAFNLPTLTYGGWGFGSQNEKLHNVKVYLPKLLEVDGSFISFNKNLKSVQLDLPELRKSGHHFLANNPTLQRLLLKLCKFTSAGGNFVSDNNMLEVLELELAELTEVENLFVSRNAVLTSLTLYFPKLGQIGHHFVSGCNKLEFLALHMPSLRNAELGFLENNLTSQDPQRQKIHHYLSSLGLEWQEDGSVRRIGPSRTPES